jgi:membrane fusion protein (multidrug efflux system)
MKRRTHAALAVICMASIAATACSAKDEGEKEPAAVVNVQTVVVTPQAFTETLDAIGNVVTRAGHVATLSAPAAGRVSQVLVTTGQRVQQGQSLIELDQQPFEVALQAAEAAFSVAEKASERQQRLASEGIVP